MILAMGIISTAASPQGWDIKVPVTYQGIEYGPGKFNETADKLSQNGLNIYFVVPAEEQAHVFTSFGEVQEFTNRENESSENPSYTSNSTTESSFFGGCPSNDSGFTFWFEDADCGGNGIGLNIDQEVDDLRDFDLNDELSSVVVSCNTIAVEWEHINFSGQDWQDDICTTNTDFSDDGYNDELSSLANPFLAFSAEE
jgi:hypothetical protein